MKDFYYILGTRSNSTPGEIGEAYRKLSQKLAPADEQDYFLQSHLNEISEAYEILSDPTKRNLYDAAYKRNHRKQLANFKTKYLNIALTCSLIIFTALFGIYVFRLINNNKATQIAAAPTITKVNPITPYKIKHHKRKLHTKSIASVTTKLVIVKKDTIKASVNKVISAVKTVPTNKIALASAAATVNKPLTQAAPISKTTPADAVTSQPVVIAKVNPSVIDSSYITYLKPNLTGSVYLHQLADYMSSVVTVLPSHSKIKVLEKGRSFYKVAFNNQVGYIPKSTISTP
jgi:hypothetical protein